MNPIYGLYGLGGIIVIASAGYFYGHHVASAECKATLLVMEQKANAQYATKVNELAAASQQLETLRNERNLINTRINKQVKALSKLHAAAPCLDADSLRVANEALRGHSTDTSKSAPTMP